MAHPKKKGCFKRRKGDSSYNYSKTRLLPMVESLKHIYWTNPTIKDAAKITIMALKCAISYEWLISYRQICVMGFVRLIHLTKKKNIFKEVQTIKDLIRKKASLLMIIFVVFIKWNGKIKVQVECGWVFVFRTCSCNTVKASPAKTNGQIPLSSPMMEKKYKKFFIFHKES